MGGKKIYIGHIHTGNKNIQSEGWKTETLTAGRVWTHLDTYLHKSASVYNTIRQEEEKSFQNKSRNILCVYFSVHIYTSTNKLRGSAGYHVSGYGAISGDVIWVSYSGEEAFKLLINRAVSCIQSWRFYSGHLKNSQWRVGMTRTLLPRTRGRGEYDESYRGCRGHGRRGSRVVGDLSVP